MTSPSCRSDSLGTGRSSILKVCGEKGGLAVVYLCVGFSSANLVWDDVCFWSFGKGDAFVCRHVGEMFVLCQWLKGSIVSCMSLRVDPVVGGLLCEFSAEVISRFWID